MTAVPSSTTIDDTTSKNRDHCRRCGRTLSNAHSVARGYGPTCRRRIRETMRVIGSTFKPHQIASATELISDGGLLAGSDRTWLAVASNGSSVYVIDSSNGSCNCKAGERGHRCYHLAAAMAMAS